MITPRTNVASIGSAVKLMFRQLAERLIKKPDNVSPSLKISHFAYNILLLCFRMFISSLSVYPRVLSSENIPFVFTYDDTGR